MAPDLWQLGPMVALEHTYYHRHNVVEHGSTKQDVGALQSATRDRTTYQKDITHQDQLSSHVNKIPWKEECREA